jgi:hypothetical protein
MENRSIQKIPLNPCPTDGRRAPLLKGEDTKKDAGQARLRRTSRHDIFDSTRLRGGMMAPFLQI